MNRPQVFGDFLLLDRLATAGARELCIAVRLGDRTGRTFVVKRPVVGERASGEAAQSIEREAEVLGAVRAPGLVRLEAAGEIAGLPYIAVDHVQGAALDAILLAGGLSSEASRVVARDLARALAALHEAGWIHGDVAPSNLVVDDAGELSLIDLGIAVRAGTRPSHVAGKAGYVAPEAVRGVEVDAKQDVYAWAIVVAECALGRRLFEEREIPEAATRGEPELDGDALGVLAPVVRRALARDAAQRPDAADLAAVEVPRDVEAKAREDLGKRAAAAAAKAASARDVASDSTDARASPASASALTPTAPMVVASARTARVEPLPAPAVLPPPAPAPRPVWSVLALVAALGVGLGFFAGRAAARPREARVSLGAPLPKRTQIEIDGVKRSPVANGGPLTISPGRHTVVVTLPRGDKRELPFEVRAGEHVVFVPVTRNAGMLVDPQEDGAP